MSKKCMICNEENQDVSRYCHMCGFRFAENDTEKDNTEEKKAETSKKQKRMVYANPYYRSQRRSYSRFGAVSKNKLFFGVLLIIIALMGCYIIKNSKNSSISQEDVTKLLLLQQMQKQSKPQMDWNFNNNTNPYFKGK